jgi:hypothetical protein
VRRRAFLIGGVSGSALVGCKSWTHPVGKPEQPDEHERKTLAAIADTFLPGDDGTPGAHEVNALATIVDPAYGLNPYISEVVSDLDQWCLATKLKGFIGLSRAEREKALEQRMGLHGTLIKSLYLPAYEGILALTKLAYFGALQNKLGTNYLAFPTSSRGYAPGTAAGAWASRDKPWAIAKGNGSTIRVEGAGALSAVKVSAFATTNDDVRATVRVRAPGGKQHDLVLRADGGQGWIDDVALPIAGGPAAGDWRFEISAHPGGTGQIELWSIALRTELDDA